MMNDDEQPDEDDRALFRHAMRGVVPLKSSRRAHPVSRGVRPRLRPMRSGRRVAVTEAIGSPAKPGTDLFEVQAADELNFRRAGVPESALRRLRGGRYPVEAQIDLHGMIATQASTALAQFVLEARAAGLRCIRVIHGKGLRSGERGPVIKNTVNALLRRSDPVLAFVSARPADGGTGATLVLLSRL